MVNNNESYYGVYQEAVWLLKFNKNLREVDPNVL
jgi:hypothetical protein